MKTPLISLILVLAVFGIAQFQNCGGQGEGLTLASKADTSNIPCFRLKFANTKAKSKKAKRKGVIRRICDDQPEGPALPTPTPTPDTGVAPTPTPVIGVITQPKAIVKFCARILSANGNNLPSTDSEKDVYCSQIASGPYSGTDGFTVFKTFWTDRFTQFTKDYCAIHPGENFATETPFVEVYKVNEDDEEVDNDKQENTAGKCEAAPVALEQELPTNTHSFCISGDGGNKCLGSGSSTAAEVNVTYEAAATVTRLVYSAKMKKKTSHYRITVVTEGQTMVLVDENFKGDSPISNKELTLNYKTNGSIKFEVDDDSIDFTDVRVYGR